MARFDIYQIQCNKTSCPVFNSCRGIGSTHYYSEYQMDKTPIDILFVGDANGYKEFALGQPFQGLEGRLLRQIVEAALPNGNVAFTTLIRGWPLDEKTLPDEWKGRRIAHAPNYSFFDRTHSLSVGSHPFKRQMLQSCMPYFESELSFYRPKMIVAMGNTVVEALFPRENRAITRLQDITLHYKGIPVRFIPHPSVMVRNPSARKGYEVNLTSLLTGKVLEKSKDPGTCRVLTTLPEAIEFIDYLKNCNEDVGFDTETLNISSRFGNKLATMQYSTKDHEGVVLPYLHPESPFGPDEIKELNKHLYSLFMEPQKGIKSWVTHNAKFENHILQQTLNEATIRSAPIFDIWIGAFLLDENRTERAAEFRYGIYTLKQLAYDYLNFDGYDHGVLKLREEGNLWDLNLKELAHYGSTDAWVTRQIKSALLEEAEKQNYTHQLMGLMNHFYNPIIDLFTEAEWNGFYVDIPHIRKLMSKDSILLKRIAEINQELIADPAAQKANEILLNQNAPGGGKVVALGRKPWIFDFSKQHHPQTLFFRVLRLPTGKVGKSGIASVDSEWQEVNKGHPMVEKFMDYVLMRKMFDSFVNQLYARVDPSGHDVNCNSDGRIRPSFFLSSVVTGRIACREPNLQACISGDSLVVGSDGLTRIDELTGINLFNGKEMEGFSNFFQREDDIYRVTSERSIHLDCSPDHIHLVLDKSCRLLNKKTEELKDDDHLVQVIEPWLNSHEGVELNEEYSRAWGYLLSGGYLTQQRKKTPGGHGNETGSYSFCNTDPAIMEDFIKCFKTLGIAGESLVEQKRPSRSSRPPSKTLYTFSFSSDEFFNRIEAQGLDKRASHKEIPRFILRASKNSVKHFLMGLFSGYGNRSRTQFQMVDYSSTSLVLTRQVAALLLGFGIPSSFKVVKYLAKGEVRNCYRLVIHGEFVQKFLDEIGFVGLRQPNGVVTIKSKFTSQNYDRVPNCLLPLRNSEFRRYYGLRETSTSKHSLTKKRLLGLSIEERLRKYEPGHYLLNTIEFIKNHDVQFLRVKNIVKVGRGLVYDCTMDKTELFWANGILTHNCPRADNPAKAAIKNIFRAPPGEVLVQLDYKANEVRWVGILAQEKNLANAFIQAKAALDEYRRNPSEKKLKEAELLGDIHKVNATRMFGVPIEQVTKVQRQASKACLVAGTMVPTKGGFKKIEEIEIGEKVWDGFEWSAVLDHHRPEASIWKISAECGWSQEVSEDHKLELFDCRTLKTEFIAVRDIDPEHHYVPIRRGDNLEFEGPILRFIPDDFDETDQSEWKFCGGEFPALHSHIASRGLTIQGYRELHGGVDLESDWLTRKIDLSDAKIQEKDTPTCYPEKMSEDLAWWLGCLISGGGVDADRWGPIRFHQERDTNYISRYTEVHTRLFGVPPTNEIDKNYLSSSPSVRQFAEYCGYDGTAYNKEVPWTVLQSPVSYQKAFLRGYLYGDKNSPKTGVRCVKAISASKKLPLQISSIFWNLGIVNSLSEERHKDPESGIVGISYIVTVTGPDFDKFSELMNPSHDSERKERDLLLMDSARSTKPFYAKIVKVEDMNRREQVYDLSLNPKRPFFVANATMHWDCVFGILYDSSIRSIAEQYQKTEEEVQSWFDAFFDAYPMIPIWKQKMKQMAKDFGYVETPHGRRRRFPFFDLYRDANGRFNEAIVPREQRSILNECLRQASNSPVQGIASDHGMIGAALFADHIRKNKRNWKIVNAVHDSCVFTCPTDELREAITISENSFTIDTMLYGNAAWGVEFILPLEVEFEIAKSWGDLQKWDYSEESLQSIIKSL